MYHRYAIYVTADPDSALARFGAAWLGWDSATGQPVAQPEVAGLDMPAITAAPHPYGFHGTVKPPFRLSDGTTPDALLADLTALCANLPAVTLAGLELARLGGFFALVPQGDSPALADMAAQVVQGLDSHRAPPTGAEMEKRRAARLNPQQEAHLQRWGYPYVMDQFRYHMTLTGRLDADTRETAKTALTTRIAALPLSPFSIDALTLLGQDDAGRFHQIARLPLSGG
ncbi:DUF1045 domain-containing protein [Pseudosulfitobacter sp. DSM 107133]|uniref:DUF1045 domain-containing protein n=1 Tax=Pseudosulfitobacter sp. DSM 107133 TaxID=2883100 RepID=UPI000DF30733|nr:DUF1045 domain-containing protein [Pseudosulfitobacter sp. DSM 107133]UOA28638.1 hypothetical protein DSM107133_03388 [Pseudosulfitobacter sp. DSM 107133]